MYDDEPEDAWDVGDPTPILVENLARRAELLLLKGERVPMKRYGISAVTLDAIADRVATIRATRTPTGREAVRLDQLDDDVAYVRGRIMAGG